MTSDIQQDWRHKDDIIECNRQMLEQQCACDVYFIVGDERTRQGAHKYMLISRSSVFAAMFCGSLKDVDNKDIDIPDVEPTAFAEMLRYIYTGTSELNANNVLPVLYAANKYDISGLARSCVSFVEERLDEENACTVMEQAHMFEEKDFRGRVLDLILRKGEQVLQSEDVGELCHQCLVDIIGADNLICQEEQVFAATDRWAGQECERRSLEATDSNKRVMLGSAIYQVRLPLLSPQVFVDKVASRSLLSEEEKVDVMRQFLVPTMRSQLFNSDLRKKEKHRRVHRFEQRSLLAWNNKSGHSAISFMTNHPVFIEGFTVYGTCRGGSETLQVEGKLLDASDNVVATVVCEVITNSDRDIYDVLFDMPSRIAHNSWYTLTANIKGAYTYAGQDGRLSAFNGDVVFTFSSSEKSETGTGIEQGQLPGLLFTL